MLDSGYFAAHASFYSGAQWLGAPNAVLTGQASGGAPVTVVVTLYSPAFSAANASLTYKACSAHAFFEAAGCVCACVLPSITGQSRACMFPTHLTHIS